jgi:hypothetical protein
VAGVFGGFEVALIWDLKEQACRLHGRLRLILSAKVY